MLAALIGLYFLALFSQDWYWPRFGVPGAADLPFNDIRFWTTAWECTRDGVDVIPTNPCDPQTRYMDHPRVWLAPAVLGLGEGSTFALGIIIGIAFFLAIFATIGNIAPANALIYAALLCSPSVMLGIERANTDLIVFVIVTIGVLLARRRATLTATLGHGLLLLAAVLKLYPAFAWGALLRQPFRRALLGGAVLTIAFATYLIATLEHLQSVREHFPREVRFSYGAPILAGGFGFDGFRGQLLVVIAGCALAAAFALFVRRRRQGPQQDTDVGRELELFWAGAGIFVSSYAVTYNFNYRLIFLLLTVPQLFRWSRDPAPPVPYSKAALTLILLALWLGASISFYPFGIGEWWEDVLSGFPYDELANWLLFAYLTAAIALTVERDVRRRSLRDAPAPAPAS